MIVQGLLRKEWPPEKIIQWLESPEGELWSMRHHRQSRDQLPLVSVKEDGSVHGDLMWVLW